MEKIENLCEQYYKAIVLLQNEEEIEAALPEPVYINFYTLMDGIIKRIDKEIEDLNREISSISNKEDKELYEEEIASQKQKREIVLKKLNTEKKKEEENNKSEEQKKTLIFAKREFEGTYFRKDLNSIPDSFYEVIEKCLSNIENNMDEKNPEKAKRLISNKKLSQIHEMKAFKIRVIYRYLTPDTAYVMMVRLKTDNGESLDTEEIIRRKKNTEEEYNQLKRDLQDETKKMLILEDHRKIKEEEIIPKLHERKKEKNQ